MTYSLRTGTLVELFNPHDIPSEEAVGELCMLISECGYDVTDVTDGWNGTTVCFDSALPTLDGSVTMTRSTEVFDVVLYHPVLQREQRLVTRSDRRVFEWLMKHQMMPSVGVVNEEVELRDKYKHLGQPARQMLAWCVQQYEAGEIYAFAIQDVGRDMEQSERDEALDQLIAQGFFSLQDKNVIVLDRTLADDMRDVLDVNVHEPLIEGRLLHEDRHLLNEVSGEWNEVSPQELLEKGPSAAPCSTLRELLALTTPTIMGDEAEAAFPWEHVSVVRWQEQTLDMPSFGLDSGEEESYYTENVQFVFQNGHILSVTRGSGRYGNEKEGTFEIAGIHRDSKPKWKGTKWLRDHYDEYDQADDVIGYCDAEKVAQYAWKFAGID